MNTKKLLFISNIITLIIVAYMAFYANLQHGYAEDNLEQTLLMVEKVKEQELVAAEKAAEAERMRMLAETERQNCQLQLEACKDL